MVIDVRVAVGGNDWPGPCKANDYELKAVKLFESCRRMNVSLYPLRGPRADCFLGAEDVSACAAPRRAARYDAASKLPKAVS